MKFIVESNEAFNEKIQATARESVEKVLYYQQTLYEMLEQTGMLNENQESPLSEEK